jgi:hypothetical protein
LQLYSHQCSIVGYGLCCDLSEFQDTTNQQKHWQCSSDPHGSVQTLFQLNRGSARGRRRPPVTVGSGRGGPPGSGSRRRMRPLRAVQWAARRTRLTGSPSTRIFSDLQGLTTDSLTRSPTDLDALPGLPQDSESPRPFTARVRVAAPVEHWGGFGTCVPKARGRTTCNSIRVATLTVRVGPSRHVTVRVATLRRVGHGRPEPGHKLEVVPARV